MSNINVTTIQQELRTIEFLRKAINKQIVMLRDEETPQFIAMQANVDEDHPETLVSLTVAWSTTDPKMRIIEAFTFDPRDGSAEIHRVAVEAWYKINRAMKAVAK